MDEPSLTIPISLLLELYKQADTTSREQVEAYIRDYKKTVNRKGHVAEGFRKTEEGELIFDSALYKEAIYRGKVDTYAESAKKEIERLKDSLSMLQHIAEIQHKLASAIPLAELRQRVGLGDAISDEDLQLLSRIQPLLKHDPET